MDDPRERELVPERVAIARYRELLGDEARDLSDEDIEAIRRHAQAMAHALVDAFRERQRPGGG
jgi:phosphate uptake regulator